MLLCAQFLKDYATYMLSPGPSSDSLHNPINSWFWWCWNANSFDTGGLVRSQPFGQLPL